MKYEFILEYLEKVSKLKEPFVNRDLKIDVIKEKINAVIGPRRVGKSTYLKYLYASTKNALYLEFEDIHLCNLTLDEILEIIVMVEQKYKKKVDVLLLDEIQEIKGWDGVLRGLINRGYGVVVTGSSSKLLSYEVSTKLRGRTISYLLLSFSFKEFLRARKKSFSPPLSLSEKGHLFSLLDEYLLYGGYPEVVLYPQLREHFLREYGQTIFYKDFVERFGIRSVDIAKFMFDFLRKSFSREISIKKIINYVNSVFNKNIKDTAYKYFPLIAETLFVFILKPYTKSPYEGRMFKAYLCDTGFSVNKDRSFLMENSVFLHLKREQNTDPLQEIYYYKTKDGYKVDFLIKEGQRIKELIQVSYANSYEEIPEREIRALLHAKEDLRLDEKTKLTVITWDYEDERRVKWWRKEGLIRFVPLWKWLLGFVK